MTSTARVRESERTRYREEDVTSTVARLDPPAFSEIGTTEAYFASHGTPTGGVSTPHKRARARARHHASLIA